MADITNTALRLVTRAPAGFTNAMRRAFRRETKSRAPEWTSLVRLGLAGDPRSGVDAFRSLQRWKARNLGNDGRTT